MLRDLLNGLTEQAVKAASPTVTSFADGEGELLTFRDGTHKLVDKPNRRKHVFGSLDAVRDAIGRWCKGGTVWHNEKQIVVVFDDEKRLDFGELALNPSEQFEALKDPLAHPHKPFVRLLRHTLADCGLEGLLALVRKVEFRRHSDGRSEVTHGKESLGRNVEAAIQAVDNLPEEVSVHLPVYSTAGCDERQEIRCSLDVDLENERFILSPLPGQLERAVQRVHASLADELKSEAPDGVDVFFGEPGA